MAHDERIDRVRTLTERAVFAGRDTADGLEVADRALDGLEADLALARGRVIHARFLDDHVEDPRELPLFERALELYRAVGDARGEAETLFWLGTFQQVVRGEYDGSVSGLELAMRLATAVDDRTTMAYALRHLGIADHVAGRLDAARERLEQSTRLRREIGQLAGVAANQVGLIYVALAQGRADDARALADEAAALAERTGADRIAQQVAEARVAIARG